jgi:hypothetical protein
MSPRDPMPRFRVWPPRDKRHGVHDGQKNEQTHPKIMAARITHHLRTVLVAFTWWKELEVNRTDVIEY